MVIFLSQKGVCEQKCFGNTAPDQHFDTFTVSALL